MGRRKKVGEEIKLHLFKILIFHISGKKSTVIDTDKSWHIIRAAVIHFVYLGGQYYNYCYSLIWVDDLAKLRPLTW